MHRKTLSVLKGFYMLTNTKHEKNILQKKKNKKKHKASILFMV